MNADTPPQIMAEGIKQEKTRRAMLAGPSCVTGEATVAELNLDGSMTVLRPGTNEWICIPGDQNIVSATGADRGFLALGTDGPPASGQSGRSRCLGDNGQ